jgi:protein-tyrosine phosphatase
MRPNLFRIPAPVPGTLSTMSRPRGGDWLDDEMAALSASGVGVLVCLLTAAEMEELDLSEEAAAAQRAGMLFRQHPIVDFGVPDRDSAADLVDELVGHLRTGVHIAVHCRAGIGRSSLIAGAVLVRLGAEPDTAWTTISTARGVTVPETDEQRGWLR